MLNKALLAAALSCACLSAPLAAQEAFPRAGAAERKIKAALAEKVDLDITGRPLSEIADDLKARHKIEVQLDSKALSDSGVATDTPFDLHLRGITLASALKLMLEQADLTYVIHDEVLLITSRTEAENLLVAKVYFVHDLTIASNDFAPMPPAPKPWERASDSSDYLSLMELMTSIVSPTTWDASGPDVGIYEHKPTGTLSLAQTQEVHEEIAELLAGLRAARDVQRRAGLALRNIAPAADEDELSLKAYQLFPARHYLSDAARREQTAEHANILQDMIAPQSWRSNGGDGTMAVAGCYLLVRQTPRVHREIASLLSETTAWPATQLPVVAPAGPRIDWPQEAEPKPAGATAAIERALLHPVELDIQQTPLNDILDYLESEFEIETALDRRALGDAGLSGDMPCSVRAKNVSLEAALRQMLRPAGLTLDVRHEALWITTPIEAENLLTLKVYPVLDLVVQPAGDSADRPRLDYGALVELMLQSLSPKSWDEKGGPGAVMAFPNCGALVVSQTREMHQQIARLFSSLREAASKATR